MRVLATLLLLVPLAGLRADEPASPLERRAREVAAMITKSPKWPDGTFDPAFFRDFPAPELVDLLRRVYDWDGEVTSVLPVRADSPRIGRFEVRFSRGGVRHLDLWLADGPGHAIRYVYIYGSVPGLEDVAAAARALERLGGKVSFAVWRLTADGPQRIVVSNADSVLDVASAVKLYILGALVREIQAGRRKWTDTVTLDPRRKSPGTGILQTWPEGSPVTLHTLASLMVSESDNTATDHLLFLLGREKVEAMLPEMGHKHPEKNVPLLSTGELFRLKYADGGKHAETYLAHDDKGRRSYIEEVVGGIPLARLAPATRTPCRIGALGWFGSADDLCAAMDWLRTATEADQGAPARSLLAIRSGTVHPKDILPYQGFKGGRVAGVVSAAYLVRSTAGEWFAVAAVWNDAERDVDEDQLAWILTRVLQLLARGPAR